MTAPATVSRVNGPLVEVDGLTDIAVADLIEVGASRLLAEVVRISDGRVTAQSYEYTGGVAPGHPVVALRRPLAARLGPGVLGGVFDGLLRPLAGAPVWLQAGAIADSETSQRRWTFEPLLRVGDEVRGGDVLGVVSDAGPLPHRVQVPAQLRGQLRSLAAPGGYGETEHVAVVGEQPISLASWWPVRRARPVLERLATAAPLHTGQRVLDAIYPIAKGGAAAVPGGFGTGKTVLLQQIAKWSDADVIVYIGCGERGNELADVMAELSTLTDPRTGGRLAERTVIIANTSNMPIMAREASIYTGVTVAEYFRDMGYHTVVIADSTSRWAEALREFSSRTGAMPAEEGYPAGLASALAAFYERAGLMTTLSGMTGSVTLIGAVSPPGGDMTEPVTSHTQRFVRTLWTLDRDLAYARHYPAVGWSGSYSRDVDTIAAWHTTQGDAGWAARRAKAISVLAEADRLTELVELVGLAALPGHERMVLLAARLLREAVLQQSALSELDSHCTAEKSAALLDMVLDILAVCEELVASGTLASIIEAADFSPVIRAASETPPDDVAGVQSRHKVMISTLRQVTP